MHGAPTGPCCATLRQPSWWLALSWRIAIWTQNPNLSSYLTNYTVLVSNHGRRRAEMPRVAARPPPVGTLAGGPRGATLGCFARDRRRAKSGQDSLGRRAQHRQTTCPTSGIRGRASPSWIHLELRGSAARGWASGPGVSLFWGKMRLWVRSVGGISRT